MKGLLLGCLPFLIAACTINVNVYDHRQPVIASPAPPPQTSTGAGTERPRRYSEIYFASTPALATIRLLSDGSGSSLGNELGTTPLTIRLSPGSEVPFGASVCGRTIIVLFEREGYRSQAVSQRIACFSTEAGAEANANELRATLSPL